jgi:multiple sugar transport system permease protein
MSDNRMNKLFPSVFSWTIIAATIVLIVLPFMWIFSTSLRLPRDSFTLPPSIVPTPPLIWANYLAVFRKFPFFRNFLNSVIVSSVSVGGMLLTSSMGAFALSRLSFRGRTVIFMMILSGLMIPSQVTIIPLFITLSKVKILDTLWSIILPSLVFPMGVFLIRQFMLTIPRDYDEAAGIDGAGTLTVYWSIIMPMVKSSLIVAAMMHLLGVWNEFFRPLIFLNSSEKMTLPLGLIQLKGYMGVGNMSVILAGVVLSLIPPFLFYMAGQKHLIAGMEMSGIKG